MIDRTANLLGVVSLAVTESMEANAREILKHAGETPAALVVIGYGFGPSNDQLRRVLRLSHPGAVRLVDRLVSDRLVERREGGDKRTNALFLTRKGQTTRAKLLKGRLAAIRPFVLPLNKTERDSLGGLLQKVLSAMNPDDAQRCTLCRLCDDSVCTNCPIPADFREAGASG